MASRIINDLEIGTGLSVSMGKKQGYSVVDKFGENPDVDTGSTPEDIWEFGGLYPYDTWGTAPIQYVSSSDNGDTGQTISVQGLDITGKAVTQEITTTGQAIVTLTTPLWRVYRMANESNEGLDLTGILYCHTDPTPTNGVPSDASVRSIITNGNNQTLQALYTIPLGKVGFLYRGEFGMSRNQTSGAARCAYYSRRVGKVFTIKKRIDIVNQGSSTYIDKRSFPDAIPALTDIRMTVESVTANNAGVYGAFDIMLVDENKLSKSFLKAIGQPN